VYKRVEEIDREEKLWTLKQFTIKYDDPPKSKMVHVDDYESVIVFKQQEKDLLLFTEYFDDPKMTLPSW